MMFMVHAAGAISKCCCTSFVENNLLHEPLPPQFLVTYGNPLIHVVTSPNFLRTYCCRGLHNPSFLPKGRGRFNIHHLSHHHHHAASKTWLCRNSQLDDEYRSSRNIAISLFRRYRNFIDRGGGDNLKEFISAGVNAYALGCTDVGLRKELNDLKESGAEIESMETYGGSTSLKSKIVSEEVNECILWLSIIFITILCTPQPTIVRWSSIPPVSDDIKLQWNGFCALIANAYFIRGMAWLPVKTLQLEQLAVVGRAEEPSVVASRMRLVFSTLEVVSPQWPVV